MALIKAVLTCANQVQLMFCKCYTLIKIPLACLCFSLLPTPILSFFFHFFSFDVAIFEDYKCTYWSEVYFYMTISFRARNILLT